MHLSELAQTLKHKIIGGSQYLWKCYGPNARYLDFESDYAHATCIFDTETQMVYEATISDKDDEHRPYRWLNPNYKEAFFAESREHSVDPNNAWDDTNWCDLEVDEDWLIKADAIFTGQEFDTRVTVPLELSREEIFNLMAMAHERDLTLNELVEDILERGLSELSTKTRV